MGIVHARLDCSHHTRPHQRRRLLYFRLVHSETQPGTCKHAPRVRTSFYYCHGEIVQQASILYRILQVLASICWTHVEGQRDLRKSPIHALIPIQALRFKHCRFKHRRFRHCRLRNYPIHNQRFRHCVSRIQASKRSESSTKKSRFKHQKEPIPETKGSDSSTKPHQVQQFQSPLTVAGVFGFKV